MNKAGLCQQQPDLIISFPALPDVPQLRPVRAVPVGLLCHRRRRRQRPPQPRPGRRGRHEGRLGQGLQRWLGRQDALPCRW